MTHHVMTPGEVLDAAGLVALYDERIRLTHEMAQSAQPTGAMAQAVLDAGHALDVACEAFRRQYYPRRAQVVVGLRTVMVCSKTRRNVETVYAPDERATA